MTSAGCATIDIHGIASMAVGHLAGLGHRRIVLVACDYSRYFRELTRLFDENMERQGLASGASHVIINGRSERDIREIIRQIENLDPKPTAAFIEGRPRCVRIMRLAREAGWSIPGDLSVLAIGAEAQSPDAGEAITTLHGAGEALLTRGLQILNSMMENRNAPARWEYAPIELSAGRTCGPPYIGG